MKPPAPTDLTVAFRVDQLPEHTATAELKQPMFQLGQGSFASIGRSNNTMYWALGTTSRRCRNAKCDSWSARLSKFSYSSEILEKHWEPATENGGDDLAEGSCRLPAQNLTEIPPRSERPTGATSSTISPLLVLD